MTAHAKFSPSSAHRWIPCPGSIVLEGRLPQGRTSNKYADEGTAAHHIAAHILTANLTVDEATEMYVGMHWRVDAEGGVYTYRNTPPSVEQCPGTRGVVDEAFIGAVLVYVNYVRDLTVGYDVYVEQRVGLSGVLGVPEQFGTSDVIAASYEKRHLHVFDLKFGTGEQVYAEKNEQGMLYALGALDEMEVVYGAGAFDAVTIHIGQPRLDHLDSWVISVEDLRTFGKIAASAVQVASDVAAGNLPVEKTLTPGDKPCRWCKAKATCPALGSTVSELFLNDPTAIDAGRAPAMAPASQSVADNELLARRYAAVEMLEAMAKAVCAEVTRRVAAHEVIIGPDGQPMKMILGREGNRAWADKAEAEGLLLGHLGDKAYEPQEIVSVAKAEELLGIKKATKKKPGVDPRWLPFQAYISRAPGQPKLALGSDPAPALDSVAPAAEEDDFTPVE